MSARRQRRSYGLVRLQPRDTTAIFLAMAGTGLIAIWYLLRDKVSNVVTSAFRTPQSILDAVAAIDPEHNPDLQPDDGATWCNKFVMLVTAALGAPVPSDLANGQGEFIQGGNDGWYPASSAAEAQAAALAGKVVVASWINLGGHGHIALVLPISGPIQIAQAGAHNYNQAPLSWGFGTKQPAFSVHD